MTMDQARGSSDTRTVLLHGFGEYAVIYAHLIEHAARAAPELQFAVILPTSHHKALLSRLVPPERLFCLEDNLAPRPKLQDDLSALASYHGSLHRDIEAEKRTFKHRPAAEQTARALEIYTLYRDFVQRVKPTYTLLSHVEGFEQKMLESLCHELGIPVGVPTDLRTIGGSFLSPDTQETLPKHRPVTDEHRRRARELVAAFREKHMPPVIPALTPEERGARLPRHQPSFARRIAGFVSRGLKHPDQFEWDYLRASVLNNLPRLRDAWWALRTRRAARWHDLASIDNLPSKFIYYPLQYTPESSINTPAPYYVDQLRVVDAIRDAMPSDHWLVIKDHWACIMLRDKALMDAIRSRSGVKVIRYDIPGREVVQRSALTLSVTGTSTLEAFLLGKPALALGGYYACEFMGGVTPLSELSARIRHALANPPHVDYITDCVAQVMSVADTFSIFGLSLPGDPVYSEGNMQRMLRAVRDDMARRSGAGRVTPPSARAG
jgi:hypothetical protein